MRKFSCIKITQEAPRLRRIVRLRRIIRLKRIVCLTRIIRRRRINVASAKLVETSVTNNSSLQNTLTQTLALGELLNYLGSSHWLFLIPHPIIRQQRWFRWSRALGPDVTNLHLYLSIHRVSFCRRASWRETGTVSLERPWKMWPVRGLPRCSIWT